MICKDCQEDEQIRYYDYTVEDMDKMRSEARKERAYIRARESRQKQREIMFKIKTECPICNDVFRQFDTTQTMKAGCGNHYFCVSCADSWRKSSLANTGRAAMPNVSWGFLSSY